MRCARPKSALCLAASGLVGAALCVAHGVGVASTPTIYKHVDENGKVTYTNAPVKGAKTVDLQPLTVVRSSASATSMTSAASNAASAGSSNAPSQAAQPAVIQQLPTFNNLPSPERQVPTASSITLGAEQATPSFDRPVANAPALAMQHDAHSLNAPLPNSSASTSAAQSSVAIRSRVEVSNNAGVSASVIAKQRREEVRRRIVEGEIDAERQLLAETRGELQREQAKSAAMRALRLVLVNDTKNSTAAATAGGTVGAAEADTVIARSLVDRHFERVRDLQDQVVMHEANLVELRALIPGEVSSVVASSPKVPVAKVVSARPVSMRSK
jgi:hypothetical protein